MSAVSHRRTAGFTLIEILVALTVFAVIGVISAQLLSQVVTSNQTLTDRGARLQDLHRAMQVMQRDIMQMTNRPIRDNFGDFQPALKIGPDGVMEFSRTGWRNPLGLRRAEIQRVAYLWDEDKLQRAYWNVLDRAVDSEPQYQTVLQEVDRVEFFVIDVSGNEYPFWPNPGQAAGALDPAQQPAGIIVRIEAAPFGEVERVWEIVGVQ